jgi:hypothetical protein
MFRGRRTILLCDFPICKAGVTNSRPRGGTRHHARGTLREQADHHQATAQRDAAVAARHPRRSGHQRRGTRGPGRHRPAAGTALLEGTRQEFERPGARGGARDQRTQAQARRGHPFRQAGRSLQGRSPHRSDQRVATTLLGDNYPDQLMTTIMISAGERHSTYKINPRHS